MELKSDKAIPLKSIGDRTSEHPMSFVNNFEILDLSNLDNNHFFSLNYSRKTFYTATLLQGEYNIEFEDKTIEITGNTLLFTTSKIPFGIRTLNGVYKGLSCIFKEDFITKNNSGHRLLELPIYKPGRQNIYSLTDNQAANFTAIYAKIFHEKLDNGSYKESLQRNYLLELIFNAQKLDPVASYIKKNNTAEEIACSFVRLLEAQFPIDNPQDVVKLKTASEFADHLSLHPNYLNRQVKLSKGRTVSDIINSRIEQEAKILLKLTNWNIAQIAYSLGFEEPSHFNTFFKKHTKIAPTDYRKLNRD